MKKYVVYENIKSREYYLKENGDRTEKVDEAKIYKVRTWLEFIIKILQILITVWPNKNLKYKQV